MKDFAALQPPIANPALSRGYRRENAHLAETVAALPPFVCEGILLRIAFSHILRAPHGRGYGAHRTASANASENTLVHGRSLFERARTYLDANCEHEIYLREVADFIGMSERQLSRRFREHDGRSVTGYVTERRLERARALLAEGHSAKEAAYACGFKGPAYFSRCFKHYTGHAPSLHL